MKNINISPIPVIEWRSLKTYHEPGNVILLTSPSAEKIVKPFLKNFHISSKIYLKTLTLSEAGKIVAKKPKGDIIYAIGGGSVVDIGKYLANKWDLKIICVPTIISTDAFLVNCTGIRNNGCVSYIPSKIVDKIILDYIILKKANKVYNVSGCCDVLSIFTGLFDWKYANDRNQAKSDEIYSPPVATIAKSILDALLSDKKEIKRVSKKGLHTIISALAMEVQLCNLYGNSRPEEGGEHFFAYCIENFTTSFLHGEMVGFGILLTSYLQGQDWERIKNFMDYIGYRYISKNLTKKLVIKTLKVLPSYVTKHHLRYSIYNDFNYEKEQNNINKFLKSINL